jgi:hypothetical protein
MKCYLKIDCLLSLPYQWWRHQRKHVCFLLEQFTLRRNNFWNLNIVDNLTMHNTVSFVSTRLAECTRILRGLVRHVTVMACCSWPPYAIMWARSVTFSVSEKDLSWPLWWTSFLRVKKEDSTRANFATRSASKVRAARLLKAGSCCRQPSVRSPSSSCGAGPDLQAVRPLGCCALQTWHLFKVSQNKTVRGYRHEANQRLQYYWNFV